MIEGILLNLGLAFLEIVKSWFKALRDVLATIEWCAA